jgi:hypothetical protein
MQLEILNPQGLFATFAKNALIEKDAFDHLRSRRQSQESLGLSEKDLGIVDDMLQRLEKWPVTILDMPQIPSRPKRTSGLMHRWERRVDALWWCGIDAFRGTRAAIDESAVRLDLWEDVAFIHTHRALLKKVLLAEDFPMGDNAFRGIRSVTQQDRLTIRREDPVEKFAVSTGFALFSNRGYVTSQRTLGPLSMARIYESEAAIHREFKQLGSAFIVQVKIEVEKLTGENIPGNMGEFEGVFPLIERKKIERALEDTDRAAKLEALLARVGENNPELLEELGLANPAIPPARKNRM